MVTGVYFAIKIFSENCKMQSAYSIHRTQHSVYFISVAVIVTTRPLDQTVFPRTDLSRTTAAFKVLGQIGLG